MLRRCVSAAVILLVIGGFVVAETVRGLVTDLSDKKVKVTVRKKKEKDEKEFTVSKDTKYFKKGKGAEAKEESITSSDAQELVKKAAEGKLKGAFATIDVDDSKVSKIVFGGGRGKKKKE